MAPPQAVKQTGIRRAFVTRFARKPGYTMLFIESNTPGVFYCLEETEKAAQGRIHGRVLNAQEVLENYAIDLYPHP